MSSKSNLAFDSIFDIIAYEKNRILKKGPQAFIGLGLAIFFFCCLPTLVYPLYCFFLSENIELFTAIGIAVVSAITRTTINLVFNHIYIAKYPYFEQYRIMNTQWPWEVDAKLYSKQYREIVINSIVGTIAIFPGISYLFAYFK